MITNEARIKILENRIKVADSKQNSTAGVVRRWKREIRNLSKATK